MMTHFTLSHYINSCNIFSRHFASIISFVTRCSSFSLLFKWPKKVAWHLRFLCMSDLVVSQFCLIYLKFIRFVAFSTETIFLSLQFLLQLFWNCPGLTCKRWNGFNIALQCSSSCVDGDIQSSLLISKSFG